MAKRLTSAKKRAPRRRSEKRVTKAAVRTRLSSKGQVVIPADLRAELDWREGDELEVTLDGEGLRFSRYMTSAEIDAAVSRVSGILAPFLRKPIPESEWEERITASFRREYGKPSK